MIFYYGYPFLTILFKLRLGLQETTRFSFYSCSSSWLGKSIGSRDRVLKVSIEWTLLFDIYLYSDNNMKGRTGGLAANRNNVWK